MNIQIREATLSDVPGIFRVRRAALDNELIFNLTEEMLTRALKKHCKAYVAIFNNEVIGFSMADKRDASIWGLFVLASFQKQGIGKRLLIKACDWLSAQRRGLFRRKNKGIRLTTKRGSQAETFYQHRGWKATKSLPNDEVEYFLTLTS